MRSLDEKWLHPRKLFLRYDYSQALEVAFVVHRRRFGLFHSNYFKMRSIDSSSPSPDPNLFRSWYLYLKAVRLSPTKCKTRLTEVVGSPTNKILSAVSCYPLLSRSKVCLICWFLNLFNIIKLSVTASMCITSLLNASLSSIIANG